MTIEKLNKIKKLDEFIAGLEHRRADIWSKATSATSTPMQGTPRAPGVGDIVGNAAAELAEIKRELHNARRVRNRLVEYIKNVDDRYIRQTLVLKFINGYTWDRVAMVIGSASSGDGVRKMCHRYLERKNR